MTLVLFVFIALTLILWSLAPLLSTSPQGGPRSTSITNDQIEEAYRRRQRMMDLEADHELGKVDETEFKEMRDGLIREEHPG